MPIYSTPEDVAAQTFNAARNFSLDTLTTALSQAPDANGNVDVGPGYAGIVDVAAASIWATPAGLDAQGQLFAPVRVRSLSLDAGEDGVKPIEMFAARLATG